MGPDLRRGRALRRPYVVAGLSLSVFVAVACSRDDVGEAPESSGVAHVHALVTNPADDTLLAATHQGVFRIVAGKAELVGKGRQDTMGLTVAGADRFYASGHPELGVDSSPHLGLIASEDGAQSWSTVALEGRADFHSLAVTRSGIYGYNSLASKLMFSKDGTTWRDLVTVTAFDLTANPSDPDHLLLTTEDGVLEYRRGEKQKLLDGTTGFALIEWAGPRTLVVVTVDGKVLTSTDVGRSWHQVGRVDGEVEALGTNDRGWQVATSAGIFESTDEGQTWRRLLDQG